MKKGYDFGGWATKNNLRCADGKIIRKGAFKVNDGTKVPMVWNHVHDTPSVILGHALLENRDEGIYAHCSFNNTSAGKDAKEAVMHGDVTALSIFANNIQQVGSEVVHGAIREVSLVLAGANPGAFIESVLAHGEPLDEMDDEGLFYTNEPLSLYHSEEGKKEEPKKDDKKDDSEKTAKDVLDTLTDDQMKAVAVLVNEVVKDAEEEIKHSLEEGDEDMKYNIFEGDPNSGQDNVLSHAAIQGIFADAKRCGSLKEAVKSAVENGIISHSIDTNGMETAKGSQTYGFNDPDMLFPEYRSLNNPPEWISRDQTWVTKLMAQVHRTPFSRIKSIYADITEDEARAKGYIKGKQKKDEVFTLLKRTTDPQTVYKRQKMDRDDIIDITDFDVVAWIKAEMRLMLNEEIARAVLIGDGRLSSSDDKIQENHIRPVVSDVGLYNYQLIISVDQNATMADIIEKVHDEIIRSRKHYKGSGTPSFWTTEDFITESLLIKDKNGYKMYKSEAEVATALRVKEMIAVEPMENATVGEYELLGTIVNMADYNIGADKGGSIEMFDDFDIDYNQYKYLIETRCSGALVKPFSAITVLLKRVAG